MTTYEQLWFAISIAGFVIFFEAAINYFLSKISISKGKIPTQISRVITGLLIFIIAIIYLMNPPS